MLKNNGIVMKPYQQYLDIKSSDLKIWTKFMKKCNIEMMGQSGKAQCKREQNEKFLNIESSHLKIWNIYGTNGFCAKRNEKWNSKIWKYVSLHKISHKD